jgi:hypothetical protein
MTDTTASETQPKQEWLKQFWADEQKRADAAGMHVIEYLMQVEDGLLKPTIIKMLRHTKAHPKTCPPDCAWQESMNRLKKKYGVEQHISEPSQAQKSTDRN